MATTSSSALAAIFTQRRACATELTGDRSKPFKMKWKKPTGEVSEVTAYHGQSLMDAAVEHKMPMPAACGGCCACSTCHVYLEPELFAKLPEADDDEADMLDEVPHQQPTSRLACQVMLSAKLHEGMLATLPAETKNLLDD